ncbi:MULTISPECIES: Arc family DNA-binding protein [unclassified Rhizobium]|uniref:Arc family DNA-binding protein n=1 Tax=unclassified Rhizobium TaxID=2613769 RepID=UPI001FD760D0|nr:MULTISPECIES: Arc family DNA-binding protein [unclassified Rhizobium]
MEIQSRRHHDRCGLHRIAFPHSLKLRPFPKRPDQGDAIPASSLMCAPSTLAKEQLFINYTQPAICITNLWHRGGISVNRRLWHRCGMAVEDLHFRLRIPEELKKRVAAAARANDRSMTAEIIARLADTFAVTDIDPDDEDLLQIIGDLERVKRRVIDRNARSARRKA